MYNESFDKLIPKENPEYKAEIPAVIDNTTFFINAPTPDGSNHMIPVGDFNAIFDALLNNDAAIKKIADALVARKINAGSGLTGGGALSKDLTINAVSANNGILVNEDNIQLQTVDNLTSTEIYKPLSANMGKKLKGSIDDVIRDSWKITPKEIGNTTTNTDLNDIYQSGFYISRVGGNKFTNTPQGLTGDGGAFELIVTGIDPTRSGYTTQILKDYGSNRVFIRTQSNHSGVTEDWLEWEEITGKVSKNGDTMTGTLTIDTNSTDYLKGTENGAVKFVIGDDNNSTYIYREGYGRVAEFNNKEETILSGNVFTSPNKYFVGSHYYGFALKNKEGAIAPALYINNSGKKGEMIVGTTGHVDRCLINSAYMKDCIAECYFYIGDYYDIFDPNNPSQEYSRAAMWFNGGIKNTYYGNKTFYIDNINTLKVGRKTVLTESNVRTVFETLFDGILYKGDIGNLTKPLSDFDMIMLVGGDTQDKYNSFYLPSQIINKRIQTLYGDANGGEATSISVDVQYFNFTQNQVKFTYGYDYHGYVQDQRDGYIKVIGIKYLKLEV